MSAIYNAATRLTPHLFGSQERAREALVDFANTILSYVPDYVPRTPNAMSNAGMCPAAAELGAVLGCREDENWLDAARRVVAERDAALAALAGVRRALEEVQT